MGAVDLRFWTVITTALIDSINPCAIGVLVLLITTLIGLSNDRKKMVTVGLIYLAAIYITYFLAGLGLLFFIQKLNIAEPLGIIVGIVVILAGLIEIKDFFWYGLGFSLSIPVKASEKLAVMAKKVTIPGAIILGIFVAAVELPCTGGPYLAITTLLAKNFDIVAVYYLLIYNLIFVLPLVVILILAYFGTKAIVIKEWKESYKRWMRLATGLLMVALGILLILYANGTITLGAF